jgi:ribonuclease BN (tRNA processing enzyme)
MREARVNAMAHQQYETVGGKVIPVALLIELLCPVLAFSPEMDKIGIDVQVRIDRRRFLVGAAALVGAPPWQWPAIGQTDKMKLILLGTGGGPRPRRASSAPAQVILINDTAYVIDCGDGVARQLVLAGVQLPRLRHIFLTHHHSDHNADYGNLILLAWTAGLRTRVDAWGPPPLRKITRQFLEMNAYDISTRIADEGRVPLAPLVHIHELIRSGVVMHDNNVKVTAAVVNHPPVVPAFGYRFDARDRSIVISGDTSPSDNLIKLAQGADVLVHDAVYPPGIDRLVAGVPNAARLKQSIMSHHTTAEDAGRVAQAAGVKMLVLSHLVPAEDPAVTDQMWIDAARVHFRGPVIVGKDLLEI